MEMTTFNELMNFNLPSLFDVIIESCWTLSC